MPVRPNEEKYLKRVKEKHGDKVEILSEYKGSVLPVEILYHCKEHGDTVKTINAKNVLTPCFNPCKQCEKQNKSKANNKGKTPQEYFDKLLKYCEEKGLTVKEKEWVSAKSHYHFKCSNPHHPEFETSADKLVNSKQGCPYCCGRRGNFAEHFKEVAEQRGYEMIGEYTNSRNQIKVRCKIHDLVWEISPINLNKGRGCPMCAAGVNEQIPYAWLKDHGYNVYHQYTFDELVGEDRVPYRFDFGILNADGSLRMLIEIDDYSHNSNKSTIKNDYIKNKFCHNNGIELHRIPIKVDAIRKNGEEWYYNWLNDKFDFLKEATA